MKQTLLKIVGEDFVKSAFSIALVVCACTGVFFTGCQPKAEVVTIKELVPYRDSIRKFELLIPKNWYKQQRPGEFVIVTDRQDVVQRFLDFGKAEGGAHIDFHSVDIDTNRTLETIIKGTKVGFKDSIDRYKLSNAMFGGVNGKKLTVEFAREDGLYKSETYFAEKDGVVSYLNVAAFGNTFDDHRDEFDKIIASVKLAKPKPVIERKVDTVPQAPEPPSDTLAPRSTADFAIQVPQNFGSKPSKSPGVLSSISFMGSRLDCSIQIDVFSAAKQKDLGKILTENKGKYQGGEPTMTTLGGQKAGYFSYKPRADANARAYFVVKGEKMYRITMNWFTPQQSLYLPIFEKSVNSISYK